MSILASFEVITVGVLVSGALAIALAFHMIYATRLEGTYRMQAEAAVHTAQDKVIARMNTEELLQNIRERVALMPGTVIGVGSQAADYFAVLLDDLRREKFGIIYLNAQNAFLSSEVLFEGSLTGSAIYPREIIKRVLELNAAAIIIGHNHPSGSVNPSERDKEITQVIRQACKTIEVVFHDHIIIGNNGRWFSFRDNLVL